MNFFKKAQEFAASASDNTSPPASSETKDAGFGSLMSSASDMFKAQNVPTENAAPVTLPGGRRAPTNEELMESSQILLGAAQGQKVENTKVAGAAGDLLGGLATYGKLDKGQYSTYIQQAEDYLHKYSGEDAAVTAPKEAAAPASEEVAAPPPKEAAAPASEEDVASSPKEVSVSSEAVPSQEAPAAVNDVSELSVPVKEVSDVAITESSAAPAADKPDRVATSNENS